MSVDGYVSNFRWLLMELKESLSTEEVDELRDDVSGLTATGWDIFFRDHYELIQDFLISTPSRRAKLKKFQDHRLKKRLVLAAAQKMKAACILVEKICYSEFEGNSYREASGLVAEDCYDIFYSYTGRYWPFDDNPPEGFRVDIE